MTTYIPEFEEWVRCQPVDKEIRHCWNPKWDEEQHSSWHSCAVGEFAAAMDIDESAFAETLEQAKHVSFDWLNSCEPSTYGELADIILNHRGMAGFEE